VNTAVVVDHPAVESQLVRQAMDEGSETDALHRASKLDRQTLPHPNDLEVSP
jgi:hypothetical protein